MSNSTPDSKLQSVLGSVGAAVITIDTVGLIVDCNDATTRMFGYDTADMVGNNVRMLMPEPYRSAHDGYLTNHLETGEMRIIGTGREVSGLHRSGHTFPMHLSVARYIESDATYFTGIIHDLTELERANSNILRLGQIVEASVNEIFVFDRQTLQFVNANRAALQNIGYTQTQLSTLTPLSIVKDLSADALQRTLEKLAHVSGEGLDLSVTLRRSDGSYYQCEATLHLSQAEESSVCLAIVQDVTEKNELRETLNRNQKIESLGKLTGGIAHDFNNILTVISGNLELLQGSIQNDDDLELVQEAREAAEMGARLTRRLLTFASRGQLAPTRIVINSLIEDLKEMLARTLGSSINLTVALAPDLWPGNLDLSELENALVNLALNARDAMPDGGDLIIATTNCTVGADELQAIDIAPGDYVCISVSDTGTGIPEDIRETLFDPFVTSKAHSAGSGMGLSMVYGFVRQSGGAIEVISAPDKGTTFSLYLPRADASDAAASAGAAGDNTTSQTPAQSILVAEDDDSVRRLTVKRLEKMGYHVVAAADGHEALDIFRRDNHHFDLVFTDVVMTEGMSGYDLAIEVRNHRPGQPVLLTSGYADDVIGEQKMRDSGLTLIRKPYQQSELARELKRLLNADD
jgi:PAS domain S-box-containing protein